MFSSLRFSLVLVTVLLLHLSTQAIHSISGACWQGFFRNWILWCSWVVPQVYHKGIALALPLYQHSDSSSFSVCRLQLTIQCEVTCAGAVMKTPTALLCWKSHFQTRLPTALFPTHYPGFAASSASGNFSTHSQLMFLTQNWATVNIWHDQFCSPTKYDRPFFSDPNQCLLLLIFYFLPCTYLLLQPYFHIFPSSIQRSLYLSCAECLQHQKLFLWVKCSPYVFADLPCQKLSSLSDGCPGLACSHLPATLPVLVQPQALVGSVSPESTSSLPGRWTGPRGCNCRAMTSSAHPAGEWPEKILVCI